MSRWRAKAETSQLSFTRAKNGDAIARAEPSPLTAFSFENPTSTTADDGDPSRTSNARYPETDCFLPVGLPVEPDVASNDDDDSTVAPKRNPAARPHASDDVGVLAAGRVDVSVAFAFSDETTALSPAVCLGALALRSFSLSFVDVK